MQIRQRPTVQKRRQRPKRRRTRPIPRATRAWYRMSVSPAPRHAHTSLAVPNSALRSRIPKPASPSRPQRSPSRAASAAGGPDHSLGVQFLRPRSTSPRPAPLAHANPPVRDRQSLVASEDSFGQTVFLSVSLFSLLFRLGHRSSFFSSAFLPGHLACLVRPLVLRCPPRPTTRSSTTRPSPYTRSRIRAPPPTSASQ